MKKGEIAGLKESVLNWIRKNNISFYDFLSIIFTPPFTFDDVIRGKGGIAAKYRIHLFTQLEQFELTPDEMNKYKQSKNREQTAYDEKIALYFIQKWREVKQVPTGDEKLIWGERNNPDKKKVTQTILTRHFGSSAKKSIKTSDTAKSHKKDETPQSANLANYGRSSVSSTADELESVLILSTDHINNYRKGKATSLKRLKVLVDLFLKEDPKASYEEMLKSNNLFLNL